MGNYQPVNMRKNTINTENSHISAYNLRCETNEGEISGQPKFSDAHRVPATHTKKPSIKINANNLEKAIIQNEAKKAIFPSPSAHRNPATQSDILSSYVVYTVRDQTLLSERENNQFRYGQNNGVIFRSANLPVQSLPNIPSLGTQLNSSINPQTSMSFNPANNKASLNSVVVNNPSIDKKGPLPEPLTLSQCSNDDKMYSQPSERLSRGRNMIFEPSSNQKILSIPNFNITIVTKPKDDEQRLDTKEGLSDGIPTSSDARFETLSTEPQVFQVHETRMKKIHLRSKSNGSSRASSGSPNRSFEPEKPPMSKVTVPPLSHIPQSHIHPHPLQNLPPLGPSANAYSKGQVSERSRYQSGSDSARQNYHLQQFLQSKGIPIAPNSDESRSLSMDKMTSLKDLIDKTGGKMPFCNPFQNENHSKTIGKEYTQEINKIAHEMVQGRDLKLSNASFDSVKSRSLSADHVVPEPNWKIIDDFFAARGWITSGIRPHLAQNETTASAQSLFNQNQTSKTATPVKNRSDKPLIDVAALKAETNYFTLCQKAGSPAVKSQSQSQAQSPAKTSVQTQVQAQAVEPQVQVQAQGHASVQNVSAEDHASETKKYSTNERVENILKRINDINSKQSTTSFVLSSSGQHNIESVSYDYTPPVVASSNNQIILSLGSPTSQNDKSSQNRLMELTKTVDEPSYSESFVFAKVSESSQPSDSVDHKERQENIELRQSKSKGKAELVLSDINKRIEEFTKILNTSHHNENTDSHKSNEHIKLDGSLSIPASTQRVSVGSPNQPKYENPEPIESQSPIKGLKSDSKPQQKPSVFNLSIAALRGSDTNVPESTLTSQKLDERRKTTTESANLAKEDNRGKSSDRAIYEERQPFQSQLQSYQPSAETSPAKNLHVPSLNVSEIQKHKFFDEKEWSQPVSPTEWNHLMQNDSSQINDKIDKIAEEIRKADLLLQEKKKSSKSIHTTPPKKEKQASPVQSKKNSPAHIPVKKYSLQAGTHSRKPSFGDGASSTTSSKKGPKEVKISINNLNHKQKVSELDSFQDEVASPRDQSPSNFVFPNDSNSQDANKKQKGDVFKVSRESQPEFEFITDDMDLNNRVPQNIFDPRTYSQNSLATMRSSQMDQEPTSSRSRPLSPFSTLDDRISAFSARTNDSRKQVWPKSSREDNRGVYESPLKKHSYSIKNIPPHRMLQKTTPPKTNEKNNVKDRSGSISERNFTLGDNSDPPKVQPAVQTYKQPSPKKTEPAGKLKHISTNLTKNKKYGYSKNKTPEPLNTRGSNGNYTSKDELDIPSVDTNYINDDFDNYSVPIRENISPARGGKKHERTVTAESEKQELIQRLSNSPFIKKYELEPPDDPSLRLEPSYVEMSDEDREKKIKQELTKLQDKIKDVDSLTRILMSDQFRELLKIDKEGVNSSKSTKRDDHLKNSPSIRDKNTSRDSSPLKKTNSMKKFGQPANLNENSPIKELIEAAAKTTTNNSKPIYKPSHRRASSNIVSYAIPNFKKIGSEQAASKDDDIPRMGFKNIFTPTKINANDKRKGIPMELRS